MEVLKATTAREITKESVTEAESLVVNGVSVSKSESSEKRTRKWEQIVNFKLVAAPVC
jgi:hypothetical protein